MEFFNNRGKQVGELKEGVYRSIRQGSKHIMKMFDAWGVDTKIMETLVQEKCNQIRILDSETGIIYVTTSDKYTKHGIERNFDGLQIFLARKYFEQDNSRQKKLI